LQDSPFSFVSDVKSLTFAKRLTSACLSIKAATIENDPLKHA